VLQKTNSNRHLYSEGYQVLFLVALTIIHMNKDRISKLQDPIEIFQILQNMPRRLIDCPTVRLFEGKTNIYYMSTAVCLFRPELVCRY
jgi:hypothetical protein